jgi:hypothetical protein
MMWSLTDRMPVDVKQFGDGAMLIAILWIATVLILGLVALLKAKPENIADVIKALSHWWHR